MHDYHNYFHTSNLKIITKQQLNLTKKVNKMLTNLKQ